MGLRHEKNENLSTRVLTAITPADGATEPNLAI